MESDVESESQSSGASWLASAWRDFSSPKKVAPFLEPRFKEANGRMCQDRRCSLPFRQPGRQFGKCREQWKRVKVICLSLRPLSLLGNKALPEPNSAICQ